MTTAEYDKTQRERFNLAALMLLRLDDADVIKKNLALTAMAQPISEDLSAVVNRYGSPGRPLVVATMSMVAEAIKQQMGPNELEAMEDLIKNGFAVSVCVGKRTADGAAGV